MVRWGLVRVTGRSMLPTLRDGDLLVIDRRRAPRAGDMAVVRLPPDGHGRPRPLSVKRLAHRESDGGWWIDSDNPAEGVTSFDVGALEASAVRAVVIGRLPPLRRTSVTRR